MSALVTWPWLLFLGQVPALASDVARDLIDAFRMVENAAPLAKRALLAAAEEAIDRALDQASEQRLEMLASAEAEAARPKLLEVFAAAVRDGSEDSRLAPVTEFAKSSAGLRLVDTKKATTGAVQGWLVLWVPEAKARVLAARPAPQPSRFPADDSVALVRALGGDELFGQLIGRILYREVTHTAEFQAMTEEEQARTAERIRAEAVNAQAWILNISAGILRRIYEGNEMRQITAFLQSESGKRYLVLDMVTGNAFKDWMAKWLPDARRRVLQEFLAEGNKSQPRP